MMCSIFPLHSQFTVNLSEMLCVTLLRITKARWCFSIDNTSLSHCGHVSRRKGGGVGWLTFQHRGQLHAHTADSHQKMRGN